MLTSTVAGTPFGGCPTGMVTEAAPWVSVLPLKVPDGPRYTRVTVRGELEMVLVTLTVTLVPAGGRCGDAVAVQVPVGGASVVAGPFFEGGVWPPLTVVELPDLGLVVLGPWAVVAGPVVVFDGVVVEAPEGVEVAGVEVFDAWPCDPAAAFLELLHPASTTSRARPTSDASRQRWLCRLRPELVIAALLAV
jgi:hypothetical protein